jgi:hypothetical protein
MCSCLQWLPPEQAASANEGMGRFAAAKHAGRRRACFEHVQCGGVVPLDTSDTCVCSAFPNSTFMFPAKSRVVTWQTFCAVA